MTKLLTIDDVRSLVRALTPEEVGVMILTTDHLRAWPSNAGAAQALAAAGLLREEAGLYRSTVYTYQAICVLLAEHDRTGV
jgi:hypothetical protein